jgi:hypothetical protein
MLQARAGTEEGARVRFAQLVVDVVKVIHGNVPMPCIRWTATSHAAAAATASIVVAAAVAGRSDRSTLSPGTRPSGR